MSRDIQVLNELKAVNDKLDLLVNALPADKKAAYLNQLLEAQYQQAIAYAKNHNPKPLQEFLVTNPGYIKTRRANANLKGARRQPKHSNLKSR